MMWPVTSLLAHLWQPKRANERQLPRNTVGRRARLDDGSGAGPAGNIDGNEGRLDAARAAFGKLPRCGSRMIRAAEGGVGRRKRPCSASTPLAELREVSLKFAKRLSLISPEALYATKRAVNRVADAAGFRTALYAGLDVVGPLYATTTELGARFRQIATTEGVPAAVRWRSAQFKE